MGCGGSTPAPDESELLPPPPTFSLPLFNEHSKGKLLGRQNKKDGVAKHLKHQQKLFAKHLPSVKDNIVAFKAEGEKGMEDFAKIGRWMVSGVKMEEVFIGGNAVMEAAQGKGRESALRPGYAYDNPQFRAFVSRPKKVKSASSSSTSGLPAIVWAHGGGIATTAKNWDFMGSAWAKAFEAVVVNPNFRHGGDAEAPAGTMDLLATVHWVRQNATSLGVDPDHISVMGNSGGGYEASCLGLELAARGESQLVKAIFLDVPMIFPDEMLGPYDGWSEWRQFEYETCFKQQYLCYAGSDPANAFEARPPWLRVLCAPDALLSKAPRHVMLSVEFDIGRWQQDLYVAKLGRCEALSDYVLLPGANHMDANPFNSAFVKIYQQAFKMYG